MDDLEQQKSQLLIILEQVQQGTNNEYTEEELKQLIVEIDEAIAMQKELQQLEQSSSETQNNKAQKQYFNVGDFCMGLYQELWYTAVVQKVMQNEQTKEFEYLVQYIGYGNVELVKRGSIRFFEEPPADYLKPNTAVFAVDPSTGLFKEASITKFNEKDKTVWAFVNLQFLIYFNAFTSVFYRSFKGTGNIVELKLQYIRLITHGEIYAPGQKKKQKSEQEIKKASKARAYKERKQQKEQQEEQAGIQKQKKWQDFMAKSGVGKHKENNIFRPREKEVLLGQAATKNTPPTTPYNKQSMVRK